MKKEQFDKLLADFRKLQSQTSSFVFEVAGFLADEGYSVRVEFLLRDMENWYADVRKSLRHIEFWTDFEESAAKKRSSSKENGPKTGGRKKRKKRAA